MGLKSQEKVTVCCDCSDRSLVTFYMDTKTPHLVLVGKYLGIENIEGESRTVVDVGDGLKVSFPVELDEFLAFIIRPRTGQEVEEFVSLHAEIKDELEKLPAPQVLTVLGRVVITLGGGSPSRLVRQTEGLIFTPVKDQENFVPDTETFPPQLREIFFPNVMQDIPTVLKHYDGDPEKFIVPTLQAIEEALEHGSGFLRFVPTPSGFRDNMLVSTPNDYKSVNGRDFVVLIGKYAGIDSHKMFYPEPKAVILRGQEPIGYPIETDGPLRHLSVPRTSDSLPQWFAENYPYDPFEFINAATDHDVIREFVASQAPEEILENLADLVLIPTIFKTVIDDSGETFRIVPLPPVRPLVESLQKIPLPLQDLFATQEKPVTISEILTQRASGVDVNLRMLVEMFMEVFPDILASGCGHLQKI